MCVHVPMWLGYVFLRLFIYVFVYVRMSRCVYLWVFMWLGYVCFWVCVYMWHICVWECPSMCVWVRVQVCISKREVEASLFHTPCGMDCAPQQRAAASPTVHPTVWANSLSHLWLHTVQTEKFPPLPRVFLVSKTL